MPVHRNRTASGVGTILKKILASWGIHSHSGCGCTDLANELDSLPVEEIVQRIDEYTEKMCASIEKWRGKNLKTYFLPQPPSMVVKEFILYACKKVPSS